MTRQVCSGCGTRFAVGFFRCPRCQIVAPLFADRVKESTMPRITSDGPSNAAAQPGEPGYVPQDAEVSLVAENVPEPAEFAAEVLPPVEALDAPVAPPGQLATAAPAAKRASGRKTAGGAS